jgi:ABC-type nitrate/sulfonate/bicarbonate transport system ATPase subunit
VEEGEILMLVGDNGCGKTTLLDIVAGLQEPDVMWPSACVPDASLGRLSRRRSSMQRDILLIAIYNFRQVAY